MLFNKIPTDFKADRKPHVAELHKTLEILKLDVDESEKRAKKIGDSTARAIKKFQEEHKLKPDGKLNDETLSAINAAAFDKFVTGNKYRTKKLHFLLQKLDLKVDREETYKRAAGASTRKALEEFRRKNKLKAPGGWLTEEVFNHLREAVIREKLKTNTQKTLLHEKLLKVRRIGELKQEISEIELRDKNLGETTKKLIVEFQTKYNLPPTGNVDAATLHKIDSVAASQGTYIRKISKPKRNQLALMPVNRPLRINKVSPQVNVAQKALAYLGYKISEKEFNTQTFGATTRKAVLKFQQSLGLPETGHLEKAELTELNAVVAESSPESAAASSSAQATYRIRGSARDEAWKRTSNRVIKIYEKLLDGETGEPLASKKNFPNGFFDIVYAPPIDKTSGQVKENFHLVVKIYEAATNGNDKFIASQTHYNVNPTHWVNFTEGDAKYMGDSEFAVIEEILQKAIGSKQIEDLHETEDEKQVTELSLQTGLSTDDIMRLILSHLIADSINKQTLTPEVFYAFIRQNLPPSLPGDLLRGTSDWETIEPLTENTATGIIFISDSIQEQTIDNALAQNLVSQEVKLNRETILQELRTLRTGFTLEKPILIGNQSLESLLGVSAVKDEDYSMVADAFISNKGINSGFWNELSANPDLDDAAIADFTTTVELGNITKNHIPTVEFFKGKIDASSTTFKAPVSFARLDEAQLAELIKQNGGQVPENTPGETQDEKIASYAETLKGRMEVLFPAMSLAAEVRRSKTEHINNAKKVETFLEDNPNLNFRQQNLDKYLADNDIELDEKTTQDLKVVQRVHKLTTVAGAGTSLIGAGFHSSMQIYFAGKSRLSGLFKTSGVTEKEAARVYEAAKMRYLQILGRLIDFRAETNNGTPAVIIPQTYTAAEIEESSAGDVPNLETLFGSTDYCECEHCKSLYSPAAYLTDILRFIDEHDSLEAGSTVKDILFQRRPDLGNIMLNCENTNTPMPYIDLVCEILENYVAPVQADFSYQTTLSAKELRAVPQYIRTSAYETLAVADYPMNSSFNLFQEESRAYLNYLRVPRFKLMETFQEIMEAGGAAVDTTGIAAEYFGISFHEKNLIITPETDSGSSQSGNLDKYWNLDTGSETSVPVPAMLDRLKLDYYQLIELLMVRFVNGEPDASDRSEIAREADSCDIETQVVTNLTDTKFDSMHRFTRLWRKTGWKMWELDLLVRNPLVGNDKIDGATLVNLKRFKQLQEKLKLPFETLLAFYGEINREVRIQPDKPETIINPLYKNLFQNVAITNPIDENFVGVDEETHQPVDLPAGIVLGVNGDGYTPVPTILSTLAMTQADFDLLVGKTNGELSVDSLSALLRYAYLAKSLKLTVKDLLLLLSVTNTADPFASPQATQDCIENLEFIRAAKFSLLELDYILNYSPDSSAGLREESIAQLVEQLRGILDEVQKKVDELNELAAFDADALEPLTDEEFLAAFAPFQNAAVALKDNIVSDDFTAEDADFLLSFNEAQMSDENRTRLIDTIKKLQANINDIIGTLEEQKQNQIKSHIASAFNLTDLRANVLLENLTLAGEPETLLELLEDESLIEKDADGEFLQEIDSTNFPTLFKVYSLLHKVALVVTRFDMADEDLEWLVENHEQVGALDFSALPIAATADPPDFGGWLDLFRLLDFKSSFPEPEEASIRSILDLAIDGADEETEIFPEIAELTEWSETDLTGLAAQNLDFREAETYTKLKKCFDQMKLTGVDAATMLSWAVIEGDLEADKTVATQTRQAVKSKYEQDDWLKKITPLHDEIREGKRAALVEYHIENSMRTESETVTDADGDEIPNPLYWKDTIALYKYFLIDVEMSACQLTSRIKQAISSVQLFVQRCFLNLESRYVKVTEDEKEDVASDNAWSQWKWMKNYRLWEANRKIFFYPENWLEPELRDDKTPFFAELESEILQNEVTKENVEAAFLNYLHKLDDVANLEICGLYHELENLSGDETEYEINIVHVVGRTKAVPHIYYYRSYDMNYGTWSAWERIDVEIQGEQVVPVVYNRKLHLFWLQFMEKPMKLKKNPPAQETSGPSDSPEPLQVLEIQLGWTIKKTGGWTPKKISRQKLVHPWERPRSSYNLKPYYVSKTNELYLDIYLSTSKEFNNGRFYDPYLPPASNPVYLTKNRFNETYLPWHSSSFVFNGEIKSIELKSLNGSYHLEPDVTPLISTNSYTYVHTNFDTEGNVTGELALSESGPRLKLPTGMHFEGTRLTNNRFNSPNSSQLRVLEDTTSVTLLSGASSPFEMVISQQDLQLNTMTADHPMFYQDNRRAFFVKPEWETVLENYSQTTSSIRKYRFLPFYHPYTTLFIREFNRDGMGGLLNRNIQIAPEDFTPKNTFDFSSYSPSTASTTVDETAEKDIVDFSLYGAYSVYNWELFFHAPLMIATRLTQNQKFEDAMNWFHYIFDPTNVEDLPTPQRYWITKPFYEQNSEDYRAQRIENILAEINSPEYEDQLTAWKNDPFNPHLIARYRPVAYQKNVVMKYLDNLIAWGDTLFGRDTIESINEASLLYMLAYEILGERPQKVPNVQHADRTYNQLEADLDEFGNATVDVIVEDTLLPVTVVPSTSSSAPLPKIETLYFCIPNNDYLFKYWDTVEDRLFKIRHCMNIQGIVRQLPLFEPPIDPAMLVKAAAAGIDLSSVLNDLSAATPGYRFRIVVQKAIEFCGEVTILGEKLLSALEKKDAEELALLRSQHEIQLLEAVREVRKKQIDEAVEIIGSLNKSFESADERKSYYEDREYMNTAEGIAFSLSTASTLLDAAIATGYVLAGGLTAIPQFITGGSGFGGTPHVTIDIGGKQFGDAAEIAVKTLSSISNALQKGAELSSTIGSYDRRKEEWDFQARLATIEKDQIQAQINAAEIRQAIVEKELENQELQIENAKAVDDYMQNKFTNRQLYSWMITQVSTVYFQVYQLAYEMAKKAENCFRYELGLSESNYVQFGYWDSLKKGLLAGDKLLSDLRRLESAYLDQNKREFEITKHISLAQMFPLALITLRETGTCTVSLPEWLFDMDYPGHYMRRIKNVSVSIPCIVGPYTGVNCTLSLLRNEARVSPVGDYPKVDETDDRFRTMYGSISSIATSSAQVDSGIFELNFNDDRYLPFEGAGVISDWRIDMPIENNYFDFSSLSDVILHINYTSRSGGGLLTTGANDYLQEILPNSAARLFSLRHEFGTEWHKFINPAGDGDEQELVLTLKPEHFPFFIRGKLSTLKIKNLDLFVETGTEGEDFTASLKVTSKAYINDVTVPEDAAYNQVHHLAIDLTEVLPAPNDGLPVEPLPAALGEFRLKIKLADEDDYKSLADGTISDMYLLLQLGTA
jgi:peptidoglycan hydrolase-like protein with peptidoglycan-binding domain